MLKILLKLWYFWRLIKPDTSPVKSFALTVAEACPDEDGPAYRGNAAPPQTGYRLPNQGD